MIITTVRDPADVERTISQYLRRAAERKSAVAAGSFRISPLGGTLGGHSWHTHYMLVLTHGRGWALDGEGRRAALSPGLGAYWCQGEWFGFEAMAGSDTAAVTLQGDDLRPNVLGSLGEDIDDASSGAPL